MSLLFAAGGRLLLTQSGGLLLAGIPNGSGLTLAGGGRLLLMQGGLLLRAPDGAVTVLPIPGDDTIVRRYADAMRRKGFQIVLRRVGYIGGQLPNPPVLSNPVLDGAALAGDTTISIRADQADGRLVSGDTLSIGGQAIAVSGTATARGPGFDPATVVAPGFTAVHLATPLAANIADGTPIVPAWSADQSVWISEGAFKLTETNSQILTGDLNITMAAFGVAKPNALDQLLIGGDTRSIVSIGRLAVRGVTVAWSIQAR